ncbi:MAG TPA: FeoB small GTPase domain-containing protein, partial [Chitinophagales bacterium]|nr:FeoB small GTPase domain-containing protein [Chitinophagales bacterium]
MPLKIALIGNPNSGKTSLFNLLTGLNQKVGNFPGVTVDRKQGQLNLPDGQKAIVIDLPGIYTLY